MKRIILLLLPLAVACSQPEKESAEDEAKRKDVERMYQQVEKQNEAIRLKNEELANPKFSLFDAEMFMTRRCKQINQILFKKGTVKLEDGSTYYVFLSAAEYERLCISVVSEKLEVLAADCGTQERILAQWNRILTTQSFD